MEQEKNLLLKSSMVYGLVMGSYWIFKYIFFILSVSYPSITFVYWGLTLSVPVILYSLMKHYRYYRNNSIRFFEAWGLGVLTFFFSALIISLLHYVFYSYIAPEDFIANSMNATVNLIEESQLSPQLKEAVRQVSTPTPIQMTLQAIFNNTFIGTFISIPAAAFVCRKGLNMPIEQNKQ